MTNTFLLEVPQLVEALAAAPEAMTGSCLLVGSQLSSHYATAAYATQGDIHS